MRASRSASAVAATSMAGWSAPAAARSSSVVAGTGNASSGAAAAQCLSTAISEGIQTGAGSGAEFAQQIISGSSANRHRFISVPVRRIEGTVCYTCLATKILYGAQIGRLSISIAQASPHSAG